MSAFNIKSTVLAARDTNPRLGAEDTLARGTLKSAYGCQRVSSAGTDLNTAGTQIRLISVPSTARISELDYTATSCGTTSLDVTAWYPTYVPQGGANFLANSLAATTISSSTFLGAIRPADTDQAWVTAFPAVTTLTMQQQEQPLWQVLGFTADPEIPIDLGFSVRTACAINGYVGLRAKFIG